MMLVKSSIVCTNSKFTIDKFVYGGDIHSHMDKFKELMCQFPVSYSNIYILFVCVCVSACVRACMCV